MSSLWYVLGSPGASYGEIGVKENPYKVRDIVRISPYDPRNPNCEGIVVDVDGDDHVFVSNVNQPFLGSYIRKRIHISKIRGD